MDHCSDLQHMWAEGDGGVRDGQMEGEKDSGVEEGERRATVTKGLLCFDGKKANECSGTADHPFWKYSTFLLKFS